MPNDEIKIKTSRAVLKVLGVARNRGPTIFNATSCTRIYIFFSVALLGKNET